MTEAHFHYFVIIAFLSLYQVWLPFLFAASLAQGYLIAPPMPEAQMTLLLDEEDPATRLQVAPAAPIGPPSVT